jgi:hypothetical protein
LFKAKPVGEYNFPCDPFIVVVYNLVYSIASCTFQPNPSTVFLNENKSVSVPLNFQYAVDILLEDTLKVRELLHRDVLKAEDFVEPEVDIPIRPWRLALVPYLQFGGSCPNQSKESTIVIP